MILMTKDGAYMNCYNPGEVARAESKGWTVVSGGLSALMTNTAKSKPARKKRARK